MSRGDAFGGGFSFVPRSTAGASWLSGLVPSGLDTPYSESLSGYLQRLGNAFLVPPGDLLRELHSAALLADSFLVRPRAMDGARSPAQSSVAWLASVSGRSDLRRCTLLALSDLGGLSADGLLVQHKRWCPPCWLEDGLDAYERKLWNLTVVDVCPVHSALLMDRCPACARQQPVVSRDVRIGVCALCGDSLEGKPVVLLEPQAADAARRLWFARQAAMFLHALDVAELLEVDAASMSEARRDGLRALVDSSERSPYGVSLAPKIDGWIARGSHPTLDALFSVLWRAKWPVIELFPSAVRSILEAKAV